jgi:predicted TPR repeat methyltransferase
MYTSCAGEDTPERAPDDFVEYTFDRFADSFESQLTGKLGYRAPQLCADMLARLLPPPARQLRMLDAGCGTGLCGPLMAPWAGVLAGVDLSRGMLDRAQTKGVYHDLYKAELTEFLRESTGHWDVVVSADTLCYFGDLQTFMTTCRTAMRGGGLLVVTVEAVPADVDAPFRLRPHGRYEHARDYLQAVLGGSGFECLAIEPQVLRTENAQPVHGWLVAARAVAAQ